MARAFEKDNPVITSKSQGPPAAAAATSDSENNNNNEGEQDEKRTNDKDGTDGVTVFHFKKLLKSLFFF